MGKHVIVGAGRVGKAVAAELVAHGHEVVIVTRRGTTIEGATGVTADASDGVRLAEITQGADALYNCANPADYSRWQELWPPIAAALLYTAEATGAVLVAANNVYGYGPVDVPMTEDMPFVAETEHGRIRVKMTKDAFDLHRAGRIRYTEVRASDYVGGGEMAVLDTLVLSKIATGGTPQWLGDPDAPHAFTTIEDLAKAMVAVATDERAWGRAWHAPTNPAISARAAAERAAELVGAPKPKIVRIPYPLFWVSGVFNGQYKAMREMNYQFQRPFRLDSTLTERTFGLTPSDLDTALRDATLAYRA
ncbi:NAD-dependent epimerase/dehydratase family protein [Hamadaea tsunoensis]|uniref:NAD-dependent epimerase/dehydratase family protein n=1 Tax=Hamadaea tsunoensis TaxID=53368 RepID=UPI000401F964|nr:NAD-dependent epimerase/dehydratase family protein [Hamadaea tsunoensis]